MKFLTKDENYWRDLRFVKGGTGRCNAVILSTPLTGSKSHGL